MEGEAAVLMKESTEELTATENMSTARCHKDTNGSPNTQREERVTISKQKQQQKKIFFNIHHCQN